jgi:small-conductance mechanosensitive channel
MIDINSTGILDSTFYGDVTIGELLMFFAILIVAIIIAKFITINLERGLKDKVSKNLLNLVSKIVYYTTILIGLLIALPNLTFDFSGLLVAGGVLGIVIGFAAQSVVSNLISGIFLIFEHPIKIGDNVLINDVHIIVEDIRILSTIGKTFDGIYVRIPNETVFTSNIINYVANTARRFEYDVEIRYADDADKAIAIIKRLIEKEPFCLKNPGPSIFVDQLASDGVMIKVRMWAPSDVWWDVRTSMLWHIKVAIEAEGIEIPFPQRTLWFPELHEKTQGGVQEIDAQISYHHPPDAKKSAISPDETLSGIRSFTNTREGSESGNNNGEM